MLTTLSSVRLARPTHAILSIRRSKAASTKSCSTGSIWRGWHRSKREDAEPELRGLIVGMLEREEQRTPLSLAERENLDRSTSSTSCSAWGRSRIC